MVWPSVTERPRSSDKVCQELPWDHCLVNQVVWIDEDPVKESKLDLSYPQLLFPHRGATVFTPVSLGKLPWSSHNVIQQVVNKLRIDPGIGSGGEE